ncbi:hypothetical protein D6D13_10392 [Aureobasidium pullulans]|uniref:F-box domain-containing protein n=1 Tax=Aureobasidium pullulans TaxID=5580 RepID=A0A4S9BYI0_AURPU|nr:hypothetical protein D6D13_10392 [Aureobasidium pullulans]
MGHLRLPPELLLLVMKHVNHGEKYEAAQNSLRNAILVNHEWAEAGTHILWQSVPVPMLARVSEDRRQYYANKMTELFIENEEESKYHEIFKNLKFPRLKTAYIDRIKLKRGEKVHLTQYMQPRLKNFHFRGGALCENALTTLGSNCPHLEEVSLEEPIDGSGEDRYLQLFTGCKALELIDLGDGWAGSITPELFAGLAGHEQLVKSRSNPSSQTLQFSEVFSLHLTLKSVSVARLASAAPSVRTLFLVIEDSEHDALASLALMTSLVHLELTYLDETELSPEGFHALEKMKNLEVLLLESRVESLSAMWLDDASFAQFISKLPKITNFEFKVDSDLTVSALTSLASSHPRIESFDFFGEYDLSDWTRLSTPLFPCLLRFVIEAPFIEGRTRRSSNATTAERATQIADLILRHCPVVEQLKFHDYYENRLAKLALRAFESKVDGHFCSPILTSFRSLENSSFVKFHPSETRIYYDSDDDRY